MSTDKIQQARDFDTDVAIVGSGFGGSVAALRLTEKGHRVTVIEKGRRWRPEDLPKSNWEFAKAFWMPWVGCRGIFGLHLLRESLILHGVGVGGGSLLYANTLFEPPETVWDDPQWKDVDAWRDVMPAHFATARRMLGAAENPKFGEADHALKRAAERRGLGHTFTPTDVSIHFGQPDVTVPDPYFGGEGPDRTGCNFCGNCMVGCRNGAKNTLDKNYLYLAEKRGARVVPDTHVRIIEALPGGGYRLEWKNLASGEKSATTARRVVVAAGVLGTAKLLMKCREKGSLPRISDQLGNVVRTNSEALLGITSRSRDDLWKGVAIAAKVEVDEETHLEIVRFSKGSDAMLVLGTMLADGGPGAPRPLRWLGNVLRHPIDFLRVTKPWGKAEHSVVLMAMQTADNHTRLVRERQWLWPFSRALTSKPEPDQPGIPSYIPVANQVARELGEDLDAIPQNSVNEVFLNTGTTAHILGGCAIGPGPETGVIGHDGQVFGHDGLYVMDGSVIGANLGVNPSLTITALAEHLCTRFPDAS